MKALPALLAATLLLAPALLAQEEPAPAPAAPPTPAPKLDLIPTQPEPAFPPSTTPEPTLIPEAPPSTSRPRGSAIPQPKKEKANSTEAAENLLQDRIRYRRAKTRALADPAVAAEWEHAEAARTDQDKRAALKRYYKLLYARMAKLDGSLKKEIALRETTSLRRLEQRRLDTATGRLDLGDERAARLDLD